MTRTCKSSKEHVSFFFNSYIYSDQRVKRAVLKCHISKSSKKSYIDVNISLVRDDIRLAALKFDFVNLRSYSVFLHCSDFGLNLPSHSVSTRVGKVENILFQGNFDRSQSRKGKRNFLYYPVEDMVMKIPAATKKYKTLEIYQKHYYF